MMFQNGGFNTCNRVARIFVWIRPCFQAIWLHGQGHGGARAIYLCVWYGGMVPADGMVMQLITPLFVYCCGIVCVLLWYCMGEEDYRIKGKRLLLYK
jgi:hypothetical protein